MGIGWRIDDRRALLRTQDGVRVLIRLDLRHMTRKIIKRDVGGQHGVHLSRLVHQRHGICAHHDLSPALVEVGFAPGCLLRLLRDAVPVHAVVLEVLAALLDALDIAIPVLAGERGVVISLRREEVRLEGDRASDHERVVHHELARDLEHVVWIVDTFRDDPRRVLNCALDCRHEAVDAPDRRLHHVLHRAASLVLHHLRRAERHEGGDGKEERRRDCDDSKVDSPEGFHRNEVVMRRSRSIRASSR